jgi:maltose O-acetyltransferase
VRALLKRVLFSRPLRLAGGKLSAYLRRCQLLMEQDAARARYDIAPSVRWEEGTLLLGDGQIAIGERTYLGHDCHLSSHPAGTRIVIGRQCALAHGIHIRTTNFARSASFEEAFDLPSESADIVIGNHVWIGNHVYIGPGVRVGDNCIIGANSVVTHDVAPDSVVGGVPARLICTMADYAHRTKQLSP